MKNSLNIILSHPQMGENIGAAARVMANFGLHQLVLVAPRDGWPNPKAADMAAKALPILDDAIICDNAKIATANCHLVFATTARSRAMHLPVVSPREAMLQAVQASRAGQQVGVLFGPERSGLENDEVVLADKVISIAVSPEYASLNLAQAVAVIAYEWKMALQAQESKTENNMPIPADKAAMEGLFGQLEAALDAVNFFRTPEKKPIMWRNVKASLTRAAFSKQETQSWRGIIRALTGTAR
jgi:tRNA/rRNA methyltransferase